jgi:DNA-binding MarR family transcriptional regulator
MHSHDPQVAPELVAEVARTCACFNFRKVSRSVTQYFDQALAPTGLRSTQLVILIAGQHSGPASIARLARDLVMDRSTLTRNLKPLVNSGLLALVKSENARQKLVTVTAAGRKALLGAVPYWRKAQDQLVARLNGCRWDELMTELGGIVEATRSAPH